MANDVIAKQAVIIDDLNNQTEVDRALINSLNDEVTSGDAVYKNRAVIFLVGIIGGALLVRGR